MRRWDQVVDGYMTEYSSRGLAESTVKKIQGELDHLGIWLKSRRPKPHLEQVDSDMLVRYMGVRGAFKNKATVYGTLSAIRGFGDFLAREGFWRQNPLRWMRGPKVDVRNRLPRRISREAIKRLWQEAAGIRQGYRRTLWLCMLSVLYGTGLRRGELVRLDVKDWDGDKGVLTIDGRKSGYQRCVAVPELTHRCIESYLVERHNHLERFDCISESAFFVNMLGRRFRLEGISGGISRLACRSGLERITLHQFRHSCASDLLESGVHLAQVRRILGHQAIETTIRYVNISDPQRAAAVKLHPINEILRAGG